MPLPSNLSAYEDIRSVLDAARAAGGARFRPRHTDGSSDERAAHRWVSRANNYRKLLRKTGHAEPYEGFIFRKDGAFVLIEPRPVIEPGDLVGLDGQPLSPAIEPVLDPAEAAFLQQLIAGDDE
jgi:hypothetical protein